MKFTVLYENLKLLDICKPVSKEEAKRRDKEVPEIKLKEILDNAEKTKLPDGTWHVHDSLNLRALRLTSLKQLNVSIVDRSFNCARNKLTSLEGCPKEVKGDFYCYKNKLTSLTGCPKEVKGLFYCDSNKLTSIEGCPKEVGGFFCTDNKLTSLEGCPKYVKGNFRCNDNSKKFTEADVKSLCDVKGYIFV